jgi:MFS family permease
VNTLRGAHIDAVRTRATLTLLAAQLVGGTGLAAAVTVGGIIAADLGGVGLSGLPLATAVTGTTVAAVTLGSVMQRHGRRRGLRWGWQAGAAGATLAIAATSLGSLPLLLVAMLLFGGAEAASTASRFAATDLPGPSGAAMGAVLSGTAVAITVGPLVVGPAAQLADRLGLPAAAGPFLLAAVAFAVAAAIIGTALRPDPLLVARRLTGDRHPRPPGGRLPLRELLRPAARPGLAALAVANLVMVGLMAIAPVHLTHAGHDIDATALSGVGLVLGLHTAGMYAPSLLSGRVADRRGGRPLIVLGGATLALAGVLVAVADGHGTRLLAPALLLLGVGWNLTFVGGSVVLTTAIDGPHRPRLQAAADAAMGVSAMIGSLLAGLTLATGGLAVAGVLSAALSAGLALGVLHPRWRARARRIAPAS